MKKIFSGIFFITFFTTVLTLLIAIDEMLSKNQSFELGDAYRLSESCLNSVLVSPDRKTILFRKIISDNNDNFVFFFSFRCLCCTKLDKEINQLGYKKLIRITFDYPIAFSMQRNILEIKELYFYSHPKNALAFKIDNLPVLMRVDKHGNVLDVVSDYTLILEEVKRSSVLNKLKMENK